MSQHIYNTGIHSFQGLWRRSLSTGVVDNLSSDLYHRLIQAYREPHRVYHTLKHIENCFAMLQKVRHLVKKPDALALAIWFHDAIYDLSAVTNEQRSADWFMMETDGLFDDELRRLVYAHIMATLHSGKEIQSHDSRFMVDIDLSSFGLPWTEFLSDSNRVREERCDISDEEYFTKQYGFHKELLERPRFFRSDYFFHHYEKQARQNLTEYFSCIGGKLCRK